MLRLLPLPAAGRGLLPALRRLSTTPATLEQRAHRAGGPPLVHQSEPWEELYTAQAVDPAEKTFGKILIANRGEIACRVIRTARRMGIRTVAVHSSADAASLFVKMADESVAIGPPPVSESYLVVEKILKAVETTGAEAVHPGYGFLSENTMFVAELEKAGVTFIGPNSKAIEGMGDKLASKRLATKAQVNGIPGFDGVVENANHCVTLANEIGYPVMIKASAGGGGKGMRIAWNDNEAKEAFKLCSEEGKAFFGDDRMLVEKFVNKPRHIEIQVLGDKHGNAIYLNERECSIQRRNQKVIEEAPSPFLDPATRAAMGEQAVMLAKEIGYDSAGTVEFLVDAHKNFYFLEMNTRLQVEHPITECITGVDLVHQMIRSAAGHPLKLTQNDIGIRGWAIENRVYAEDPFKNFGMPSIGRLYKYQEPKGLEGVRCDSGIEEGSEISLFYDPMICKLTTYGADRREAIDRSVKALDHYVIRGVMHNISLLRDILLEKKFLEGDLTTNYLPETYPEGFTGVKLDDATAIHLAALACAVKAKESVRAKKLLNYPHSRSTLKIPQSWDLVAKVRDKQVHLKVNWLEDQGVFEAKADSGEIVRVTDDFTLADAVISPKLNDERWTVQLLDRGHDGKITLQFLGTSFEIPVMPAHAHRLAHFMPEKPKLDLTKSILTPMPGVVTGVEVGVGDAVNPGQAVCYVEAMKMKNAMTAAIAGKVKAVHVEAGQKVEEDTVLIELE